MNLNEIFPFTRKREARKETQSVTKRKGKRDRRKATKQKKRRGTQAHYKTR